MKQENIRNFSIIAHIDHGKSTLADRLLEQCGAVAERDMENQLLDNMDLERERGITIKARAVTLDYTAADGETYTLNLIDTPGHVDFNYEVCRSLAACEGALLVVDASQGIEAQTLANTYLAMENDLEIRPVVNKIDLPAADPERVKHEIEDILALPAMDAPEISAKMGINIPAVLEDVVANIPAPTGDPAAPLRALIFDSYYDAYKGVIVYFRIMEGTVRRGMNIQMMASGAQHQVLECGLLRPLGYEPCEELHAGQVGYLTASIKDVKTTEVGDTITGAGEPRRRGPPRLPEGPAHGLLRHLHRGRQQVPGPAGRPGEAPAQRRLPDLRAGELRGPGLRVPVRLSGHAPQRGHPGAAGAGVRPGPGHHHALGHLPRHQDRRHRDRRGQPPQLPRPLRHRRGPRSPMCG